MLQNIRSGVPDAKDNSGSPSKHNGWICRDGESGLQKVKRPWRTGQPAVKFFCVKEKYLYHDE
jgi:hypothetical protein